MTTKRPSVLVIGLDAADPGLLTKWMDSGLMPNLRSIRDDGVSGGLQTPSGLGDDATWASFSTGSDPGTHGRFFHRQPFEGSYASRSFKESDFQREPFWNHLSRSGCKVAVVDVPKSPLSQDLNGIQLADWRVHGRDGSTRSWPPELARRMIDTYGDDDTDQEPHYLCRMDTLPKSLYAGFVDRLLTSVEQKANAAAKLLTSEDWDLFLVVFKEAHCVGHQCWHLMDTAHPEYDAHLAEQLSRPMERVYGGLDRGIGKLIENVSSDTVVIVFSSLGMSVNTTGEHLLDSILLRLEPSPFFSVWQRLYAMASRYESRRLRRYVKGAHRRLIPHRTAFQVEHNELSGAVRLNLKGRDPEGRVSIQEGKRVLDRLEEELLALVDRNTGLPIVSNVIRAGEAFEGRQSDRFADLFVEWNRDVRFTSASSATIGTVRVKSPSWRTGNHVSGGIFFGRGPLVGSGQSAERNSIIDLAPSIAAILGHDLPDADGRPIAALVGWSSDAREEEPRDRPA